MSAHEPGAAGQISLILAAVFLLVVVGGTIDLLLDRPTEFLSLHVVLELTIIVASLSAATFLAMGWTNTNRRLAAVSRESKQRERERREWQQRASDLLSGLSRAVAAQLEGWGLTPAEQRVALLLLQGCSHKRIARLAGISERTARQHSVAVYRKAGVAGRAELAGFFLSGLEVALPTQGAPDGKDESSSL